MSEELEFYKSKFDGTTIDKRLGMIGDSYSELLKNLGLQYYTNTNLLDNWFFVRPVNQRDGYYIPAGTKYNTLSWTEAGTTDKAYPVVGYSGQDPLINVNGTNYIVGKAAQIPGYCTGYSYTIDRWKTEGNIVVTLDNDGISIENVGDEAGQFKQDLPSDFSPEGTLLCISVIVKSVSGDARLLLSQSSSPYGHTVDFIPLQTGLFSGSGNLMGGNHKFSIHLAAGAKVKLVAVKLELGDQQTLAHKEGDKWVLNEIPDYGEQLRRCQRYAVEENYHTTVGQLNYDGDRFIISVQFPCTMRTSPVITLKEIHAFGWGALPISGAEVSWNDKFGFFVAITDLTNMNNFIGKACSVKYFASADL